MRQVIILSLSLCLLLNYASALQNPDKPKHPKRRPRVQACSACPEVEEMIEPLGGMNLDGMYVKLHNTENGTLQRFFEYSCGPEVLNKPCGKKVNVNIINALSPSPRCVQKYMHVYALVEKRHGVEEQRIESGVQRVTPAADLDYIRIRRACVCE